MHEKLISFPPPLPPSLPPGVVSHPIPHSDSLLSRLANILTQTAVVFSSSFFHVPLCLRCVGAAFSAFIAYVVLNTRHLIQQRVFTFSFRLVCSSAAASFPLFRDGRLNVEVLAH